MLTDLQTFAFLYLPLGVCVFGALLAAAGVTLITWADRWQKHRHPAE